MTEDHIAAFKAEALAEGDRHARLYGLASPNPQVILDCYDRLVAYQNRLEDRH